MNSFGPNFRLALLPPSLPNALFGEKRGHAVLKDFAIIHQRLKAPRVTSPCNRRNVSKLQASPSITVVTSYSHPVENGSE